MDATLDPDALRRRAAGLRRLAERLDTTPAMSLDRYAGAETWSSPRAELCRHLLEANRIQVRRAVEDLYVRAHRLERRAEQVELAHGTLQ